MQLYGSPLIMQEIAVQQQGNHGVMFAIALVVHLAQGDDMSAPVRQLKCWIPVVEDWQLKIIF